MLRPKEAFEAGISRVAKLATVEIGRKRDSFSPDVAERCHICAAYLTFRKAGGQPAEGIGYKQSPTMSGYGDWWKREGGREEAIAGSGCIRTGNSSRARVEKRGLGRDGLRNARKNWPWTDL